MTSPFSVRKRAEEFAAFLDGGSPATSEHERLGSLVTALREHEPAAPRPEFSTALRERLMTEAERVLTPGNASLRLPARTRGTRERRLVAAASALVLLGGTAGMAAAAQDALPGEALYPIKRGLENAEAGLSVSPAGKGRDLLRQADVRLVEVEGLLEDGAPTAAPQIPGTLDAFTEQASAGADLLLSSFEETRDPATIAAVRVFAAHSLTVLQQLGRTAPPEARDELAAAAALLSEIDRQATMLCASCAPDLPTLLVPDAFLAAAEVDRALAGARAARLDNSHPVTVDKRALSKAVVAPSRAPAPSASSSPSPAGGAATGAADDPVIELPDGERIKTGKDLTGVVGGTLGDAVDGATDGLGGLVETLLPDPTSLPKLLP
jgi:hypothetical protein